MLPKKNKRAEALTKHYWEIGCNLIFGLILVLGALLVFVDVWSPIKHNWQPVSMGPSLFSASGGFNAAALTTKTVGNITCDVGTGATAMAQVGNTFVFIGIFGFVVIYCTFLIMARCCASPSSYEEAVDEAFEKAKQNARDAYGSEKIKNWENTPDNAGLPDYNPAYKRNSRQQAYYY